MIFELLPTIDMMLDLYGKPRTAERFQEYLKTLQGDTKGDLAMPIGGFNPMGKEHLLQKLTELKELNAEQIIQEIVSDLNNKLKHNHPDFVFKVALNLADDLKGGWTNRYTTDYDSKFKINALVNRRFCTPFFWSGESYTTRLINERTLEYVYRTLYWLTNPKPKTLREHIEQEKFVAENTSDKHLKEQIDFTELDSFYKEHEESDDYSIIFNFLYGDHATKSLEFPTFGIKHDMAGFKYARQLVK